MRPLFPFGLSLLLGVLACSEERPGGGATDARSSIDAGTHDGGLGDGGDGQDGGRGDPDGGDNDGGTIDGGSNDGGGGSDASDAGGGPDGGAVDGGPFSCPIVEPDPGVRHPNSDGVEYGASAGFAVNPCTGEIGYAWSARAGGPRTEIFFRVLAKNGVDMSAPVRLTAAPGASSQPQVVFVRDRYVVLWTDQRHDPIPDACMPCREELYFAALDLSGGLLLPERRLTNKPNAILHLAARGHAETDRVLATWVDRRNGTEIYGAFIGPDGTVDVERQVNDPNTGTEAYYPRPLWNGQEWLVFYSDRQGSDQRYVRTFDRAGTLGAELTLGWGYNQATALHGTGYVALATGTNVFSNSLLFLDSAFQRVTELEATFANTFDGTWDIRSTGTSIWVTMADNQGTGVNELNSLGVLLRHLDADPTDTGQPSDVDLELIGNRLVLEWNYVDFRLSVLQP